MMSTSLEQATVSMETQTPIVDLMAVLQSATQTATLHLGLPLTTALQSPFKGLRYSTEEELGSELEMLTSASQTCFQLLAAKCFLAAPSSAILLDLPLMDNTLSSQVKSCCESSLLINIPGQETSGRYVIVQMDNGGDPLNLQEVEAFGRVASDTLN